MKYSIAKYLLIGAVFSISACGMVPLARKSAEEIIFPESITIVDVNNAAMLTTDVLDYQTGEILYDYYFTHKKSDPTPTMYLQAVISPKDSSYPEVSVFKDEQNKDFEIIPLVEEQFIGQNMFVVKPTSSMASGATLLAAFTVETKNPGVKISAKVCVSFYRNTYN